MSKKTKHNLNKQFIEASENGHVDVVRDLLDAGADIHDMDDYALRYASQNGHDDVVRELLAVGANVHVCDDYALRWASQNGHVNVVRELLAAGANVHVYNDLALRLASLNGHVDVVLALAEHAKLNEKQAQKWYDTIIKYSKQHQLLLCVLPLITRWMKS
jgi:ankyrin repeat protein